MRVVFTPWGSFGDLHPYLAIAIEMQRRGHDVLVATSAVYREKVEGEGVAFHPVRPEMENYFKHPERIAEVMNTFRGSEYLFRRILMPAVRDMYADLCAAVSGADLIVSHIAMPAAPVAAEKTGIRWISAVLQPSVLWSCMDPPSFPVIGRLIRTSPARARLFFRFVKHQSGTWMRELYKLRRELGVRDPDKNPLFEGTFSPLGILVLFSRHFAQPQPDWPPNVTVAGFPFYDKLDANSKGLTPEVEAFLAAGPPPVVFTLGTSAVFVPSDFYRTSAAAIQKLDLRAILLAGTEFHTRTELRSSEKILVTDYAPYSKLFPHAAAVVHSGGIGTTAQVLRAGKPMIVIPFSHDQPDNAARAARLGVGTTISRSRYGDKRVAREIETVLMDSAMARRAAVLGEKIRAENAVQTAADALERL
jgi:rhamnosyltransferase subunit B